MSIEEPPEMAQGVSSVGEDSSGEPECGPCPSKEILSESESGILSEMRGIKEQLHPIADRLRELESRIKEPAGCKTGEEPTTEWAKLQGQVSELRAQWREWQERLDKAIEQKLICLGHREPE